MDERGITYHFTGSRGLFQRPEVKQMIALLQSLYQDSRPEYLYLLASEGYHVPEDDLSKLLHLLRDHPGSLRTLFALAVRGSLSVDISSEGIERIAEVPIYQSDSLVRRSPPLQQTADARRQRATMNAAMLARLNLQAGEFARFLQRGNATSDEQGEAMLTVEVDERVPDGCIRLPAALPTTAGLGAITGTLTAERIS